jgi:hypothetical protein
VDTDGLDIFSPDSVDRSQRIAQHWQVIGTSIPTEPPFYTPVNEISFIAWAARDVSYIYPFGIGRGTELERQFMRVAMAGFEAIWDVNLQARIVQVEPVIHVMAGHWLSGYSYQRSLHRFYTYLTRHTRDFAGALVHQLNT